MATLKILVINWLKPAVSYSDVLDMFFYQKGMFMYEANFPQHYIK